MFNAGVRLKYCPVSFFMKFFFGAISLLLGLLICFLKWININLLLSQQILPCDLHDNLLNEPKIAQLLEVTILLSLWNFFFFFLLYSFYFNFYLFIFLQLVGMRVFKPRFSPKKEPGTATKPQGSWLLYGFYLCFYFYF